MGNRTYMYRLADGEIESKVFDSDEIPEGWVDNPQLCSKETEDPKKPEKSEKEQKDDLELYAYENYEVDLDKRKSLDTLKAEVKALDDARDSE